MIDPKKIEEMARQVHEALPKSVREFGEDIEKKIRLTIQGQLSKLDVVNREEFDVQTQVLLRSREKLAQLEKRVADLEARLNQNSAANISSDNALPPVTSSVGDLPAGNETENKE